jgi:hypothetical protein
MYVFSNLNDQQLHSLSLAVHAERRKRFMDKFSDKDWPRPVPGMTRIEYTKYLHRVTHRGLMECHLAAEVILGGLQ